MTTYAIAVSDLSDKYQQFIRKYGVDSKRVGYTGNRLAADGNISKEDLDCFDRSKLPPGSPEADMFAKLHNLIELAPVDEVQHLAPSVFANVDGGLNRVGPSAKAVQGRSHLSAGVFSSKLSEGVALDAALGPEWIFAFEPDTNTRGIAAGLSLGLHATISARINRSGEAEALKLRLPIVALAPHEAPLVSKSMRVLQLGFVYAYDNVSAMKEAGLLLQAFHIGGPMFDTQRVKFKLRLDLMDFALGKASPDTEHEKSYGTVHHGAGAKLSVALSDGNRNIISVGADFDHTSFLPGTLKVIDRSLSAEVTNIEIGGQRFGLVAQVSDKKMTGPTENVLMQDQSAKVQLRWLPPKAWDF